MFANIKGDSAVFVVHYFVFVLNNEIRERGWRGSGRKRVGCGNNFLGTV